MTAGPDCGDFRAVPASSTSAIPGVPSEGIVKSMTKRDLVPRACSGLRSAAPLIRACWKTCGPMRRSYK